MKEIRTKLSPPWVTYINKVMVLFGEDPEIQFDIDYFKPSLTIQVDSAAHAKATAISSLLPSVKFFGNISLFIEVRCKVTNLTTFKTPKSLFDTAFSKNPCFSYTISPSKDYWSAPFTYVVFKNKVVQFFSDNLDDPHGITSTLYQNIAEELFSDCSSPYVKMVSFCTDTNLGVPLEDWP